MPSRVDELEDFKTSIDLRQYAATQGYALNRRKSYGSSSVMVCGADTIVIGKNSNGHWIYWQVDTGKGSIGSDAGSIIDFVQNRRGGSLGDVRKELRPWLNGSLSFEPQSFTELKPVTKDLMKVRASFELSRPVTSHPYLEQQRLIPADVLADPLFSGRVRIDWRGNACFPHINTDGLCGFEIKNLDFTGFSSGGTKGLWCSRVGEGDTSLIIAETAVDALSHFALKRPAHARYVSTGGSLNESQQDLLRSAMEKMPPGSHIILALDHDEGGDKLAARLMAIFDDLKGAERVLVDERPPTPGEDWNDVLRAAVAKSDHRMVSYLPDEASAELS